MACASSTMREVMSSLGSPGGLLPRIPGMGQLAGAGAAGPLDPEALLGGMGSMAGGSKPGKAHDQKRQKGKRKQARRARRKNRKR